MAPEMTSETLGMRPSLAKIEPKIPAKQKVLLLIMNTANSNTSFFHDRTFQKDRSNGTQTNVM